MSTTTVIIAATIIIATVAATAIVAGANRDRRAARRRHEDMEAARVIAWNAAERFNTLQLDPLARLDELHAARLHAEATRVQFAEFAAIAGA